MRALTYLVKGTSILLGMQREQFLQATKWNEFGPTSDSDEGDLIKAFFTATGLDLNDVNEVLHSAEGWNDGDPWLVVGISNGKYFFAKAGCDYTGWGCHGDFGWLELFESYEETLLNITDEEKAQMGI